MEFEKQESVLSNRPLSVAYKKCPHITTVLAILWHIGACVTRIFELGSSDSEGHLFVFDPY